MESTEKVTKGNLAIKYGLISGLVGIIIFVIRDIAGLSTEPISGVVTMILSVGISVYIIVLAHGEYKASNEYMSYGEGLGIGVLLSVVGSIISGIFTYIYISFINSAYLENVQQQQIMSMEEQGMSEAQIDQAMELAGMFSGPIAIGVFAILGGIFFGFIISLIVAAVTKRVSPEFE